MMEGVSTVLLQRLMVIFWAGGFGLLASLLAWKKGYYWLPLDHAKDKKILHGKYVFQAFAIFLSIEMVLVPALYSLWIFWKQGSFIDPKTLNIPLDFQGWFNLAIISLTGIALTLFFSALNWPTRLAIWGSSLSRHSLKQGIADFLSGSVTWVIVYPWIIVIGQLLAIVIAWSYSGPLPDQVAVKHLKDIQEHPLLFIVTIISVISVIPFIEELLFRGFLQSWLKVTFSRAKAILLTSLIFASFHFSVSQGIENIEFLSSLFLLSCFLGFIKERQQSLWASIGLHSTFNLISILMLLSG